MKGTREIKNGPAERIKMMVDKKDTDKQDTKVVVRVTFADPQHKTVDIPWGDADSMREIHENGIVQIQTVRTKTRKVLQRHGFLWLRTRQVEEEYTDKAVAFTANMANVLYITGAKVEV